MLNFLTQLQLFCTFTHFPFLFFIFVCKVDISIMYMRKRNREQSKTGESEGFCTYLISTSALVLCTLDQCESTTGMDILSHRG